MHRPLLALCAAATFATTLAAADLATAPAPKPNVVLVVADDLTIQALGAYRGRFAELLPTPHIDRLAAEGMRFDRCYATNSVCAPSRATMFTGTWNHINGVTGNEYRFDGDQPTFPKGLQSAGYQTAIIGKWHLETQPTGFDHYELMLRHGRWTDCPLITPAQAWTQNNRKDIPHPSGYLTDVITERSLAWLDTRDPARPFCLVVAHKAPHASHQPAPRHANLLADLTIPEPATLYDAWEGREPALIANLACNRLDQCSLKEYQSLRLATATHAVVQRREMYQAFMKGYLRLVASLDENVGRLMEGLEQRGLGRDTLVVFTSDNGFFTGEHGFYNKMWMYEPAHRLPCIARWPGRIAPGSVQDGFITMADLAPTLLALAGAPIPARMQGRDVSAALAGGPSGQDAVYYHYHGQYEAPAIVGMRTATQACMHYPESGNWELFDTVGDPAELQNLAKDPARAGEMTAWKQRLRHTAWEVYRDPVNVSPW